MRFCLFQFLFIKILLSSCGLLYYSFYCNSVVKCILDNCIFYFSLLVGS